MKARFVLAAVAAAALSCGYAIAQGGASEEARAFTAARREAAQAMARSQQLERQAEAVTSEAAKARAAAAAVAARIEAAEADLTAAETRIRIIENLRADQRARLAERQGPVVRLTAALQTMTRRPPVMALVQPGSVHEVVHVRSLLASTLPVIRARTAILRREIEEGNRLRRQAELALGSLRQGQEELNRQRLALARLEARQRARSAELASYAVAEGDRALSLNEEARDLAELMNTREHQARVRESLSGLPGPLLRPGAGAERAPASGAPPYIPPAVGEIVTGMGEISDGGVHARGLTLDTEPGAEVVAPRAGRIVYAGRFRSYGTIVILDHGGGWTSVITDLAAAAVTVGQIVRQGQAIGRAGAEANSHVSVELRRNGRPYSIASLLRLG